jgi:hypothetical protein
MGDPKNYEQVLLLGEIVVGVLQALGGSRDGEPLITLQITEQPDFPKMALTITQAIRLRKALKTLITHVKENEDR